MIDISAEQLLSLPDAAKLVPPGRSGKPTHVATLVRWLSRGLRGVRLEAVRMGGRWLTSREALQRFADRLTTAAQDRPPGATRHPAGDLDRQLDDFGI